MPLQKVIPVGYYEATLDYSGAAVPNGAAMTFGGSAAAGTPATVGASIIGAWSTHLRSVISSLVVLDGVRVKFGPVDDGPFAFSSSGLAGSLAGSMGPPNLAILIRKNTAIGGRQGSGRFYQPSIAEANVDEAGLVSSGFRTTLQTAYSGFFGGLQSVSLPMYLLHSWGTYTKLVGNDVFSHTVDLRAPTEVTSLSVDARIATQRRRLR